MAINKFMRMALKALSYPDIDLKKVYKLQRTVLNVKAPHVTRPFYQLWEHKVYCRDREILVRIYPPKEERRKNILVFFHGGGWVTESIDTYHNVCKNLARLTGCKVVSVDYRLAPENPFPSGLEDCYIVTREILLHPGLFDISAGEVTLIGDSAGGNLAAAVSLMARDRGEFQVPSQILIYPATYNDHTERSPFPSVRENGTDYLLTSKHLCEYMEMYGANPEDFFNPYFAPLLAEDLTNQPDTLVITAEYDPLRDEGEAFGRALTEAGNRVKIFRMLDALHGFFAMDPHYVQVKKAYELINQFLDGVDAACQVKKNEDGAG